MAPSSRPLQVGTLCITLLRKDPANAGRIVVVLEHVGSMNDLGFSDGYLIEAADDSRLLSTFVLEGQARRETLSEPSLQAYTDRRYLLPLLKPEFLGRHETSTAAVNSAELNREPVPSLA